MMTTNKIHPYNLDKKDLLDLLEYVNNELEQSSGQFENDLRAHLWQYEHHLKSDRQYQLNATIEAIGTAVKEPESLSLYTSTTVLAYWSFPDKALEWGKKFMEEIIHEVRNSICGENKEHNEKFKTTVHATAVSISGIIVSTLGFSEPAALGLATFIIITIAQATKNAFCTMTDDEILKAIDKKINEEKSND